MKGTTKATKFATCQCPKHDEAGAGKDPSARFARKQAERRDSGGKVAAVTCDRCLLPITLVCRHCGGHFEDIDEHCKRADSCGLDVAYRAARAVTGGGRVSKKAPKAQAALFSDDVLRGPRREGMGGR